MALTATLGYERLPSPKTAGRGGLSGAPECPPDGSRVRAWEMTRFRYTGGAFCSTGADVCEYPLARNLIQFAVALASEVIVRFAVEGVQQSYSFTLRDLCVNAADGA